MRLDAAAVRYLTEEDRHVLLTLEAAMMPSTNNHATSNKQRHKNSGKTGIRTAVPLADIAKAQPANSHDFLRPGALRKVLVDLQRRKLISIDAGKGGSGKTIYVEGCADSISNKDTSLYRLTYGGFDALALQDLSSCNILRGVGRQTRCRKGIGHFLGHPF